MIAGYVRVSSFRQATEGDSLEAQQKLIQEYVQGLMRQDGTEVKFYVERGRSGKDQNRPELQRLRGDVQAGRIGTHRVPTGQYPFLLKGIIRCKCGHMMTSYFSTSRDRSLHYYYACTNRTHNGRKACDAPYVPARAIDEAVVGRLMAVTGDEKAQEPIVQMAIGMAAQDLQRVGQEIERVKQRISKVRTEIGNLVNTLKAMGEVALASVGEAIRACEAEMGELTSTLDALVDKKRSLEGMTGDAEQFLAAWRRLRDLFGQASQAVKREIVQAFVEELVWR